MREAPRFAVYPLSDSDFNAMVAMFKKVGIELEVGFVRGLADGTDSAGLVSITLTQLLRGLTPARLEFLKTELQLPAEFLAPPGGFEAELFKVCETVCVDVLNMCSFVGGFHFRHQTRPAGNIYCSSLSGPLRTASGIYAQTAVSFG